MEKRKKKEGERERERGVHFNLFWDEEPILIFSFLLRNGDYFDSLIFILLLVYTPIP